MNYHRTTMRTAFVVFWALALVTLDGAHLAKAQLRWGSLRNERSTVFAIAPREATRPLKIAEKAIEDGDFPRATSLLGDLLADTMLNEYLIPDEDREFHAISLRQKAEQLLGKIPSDERGSYEEKYGVKAKVMLQKAIEANDTQAIAMTSRLYFHTRAGLEATMLVGHNHLAEGRPVMAAVAFEKVARQPQGSNRFDPEATLLAAVSWSLNGSTERSDKLLLALKKKSADSEIRFYGKTIAMFEQSTPVKEGSAKRAKDSLSKQSDDAKADPTNPLPPSDDESALPLAENSPLQIWLKQIVGSTQLESHPIINQWLVFRGDSKRNAESGSGFPLLSPRWSIRTVTDPVDETGIQEFQQKLIQAKISPLPKVHPLAVGKTLVIRTDDRMFGVDADTGKRIWSYPPANVFRSGQQKSEDSLARTSSSMRKDKLRERLWLDALYGQISSDGSSIFLIPNPGISTDKDDWGPYNRHFYDEPTDLRRYNELKSLDLKQHGALQWQVGGETGLDEPELAKSFFLGAPLPLGERLYAICVQDQSVRLVVLDAETGRLQWSRHLASTEDTVKFREERLRRLAGATPSEANGILICPTGLNAIVAVDLATQSLSWGFHIKKPQRARVGALTEKYEKWNKMWRDATVTLTDGAVIYTPVDSTEVFCLNLQTGESLWVDRKKRKSRAKNNAMHVETIRNGNIIITASNRLKAIDLKTGAIAWETPLNDFGLVSGRGYVSGDHCFIPTTTKRVLRVNTSTGEIDGAAMTEKVLGNLISFRGDVLSHGADHLTAYPRDEPSRLMITQQPDVPQQDHLSLAIEAQLNLIDGKYQQSVDAISQAYDLFPNSNYALVLVQALTRLIEVDFEKAEQVSDRYQNLFKKQDLHRLLRGKVTGLIKLKRFEDAFETLLEIAETVDVNSPSDKSAGKRIEGDNSVVLPASSVDLLASQAENSANAELTMQLTQWLRWRLHDVYQSSTPQAQKMYRAAVAQHLNAFHNDPLTIYHDRIRLFPVDALGESILMQTAADLLAAEEYVRADSLLANMISANDSAKANDGSNSDASNSIVFRAESLLRRMTAADFSPEKISKLENTIAQLRIVQSSQRDILDKDLYKPSSNETKVGRILRTEEVNYDWFHDITHLEQEKLSNYFINTQHFCEVVATDQPELNTLSFRYSDEFREFQMYDSLGRFVHKIYLDPDGNFQGTRPGTKGRIFLQNSLMLLCIDKEMFALDWEKFIRGKAALLWHADNVTCSSSGLTRGNSHGVSVISQSSDGNDRDVGTLMSLDPFTGEAMWQRSQVTVREKTALLEGDQSITVWMRSKKTHDKFDPMMGRLISSGKIDRRFEFAAASARDLLLFLTPRKSEENEPDEEGDDTDTIFNSRRPEYQTDELNLFDFNQESVLWTKNVAYPAKLTLVDQDNLLVLSGDGVFSLIDMRSGELKFETRVPELNKSRVSSIYVDKFNGLYVVTVYVYTTTQPPTFVDLDDMRVRFQRVHKDNEMINGNVIALDAQTGQSVWKHPIAVQRFQMLEGLPWDSPFLFFTRKNVYGSDRPKVRIQMAAVDLQSGKLKANELFSVPVRDNVFYSVICQPHSNAQPRQSIELQVATLKANFYLGNIATAPQPVAALTNPSSLKRLNKEISSSLAAPTLATDLQKLTEQAIAAEKRRKELGAEEVRLTELEMKKQ